MQSKCFWDGCIGITFNETMISALANHAPLLAEIINLMAWPTDEYANEKKSLGIKA